MTRNRLSASSLFNKLKQQHLHVIALQPYSLCHRIIASAFESMTQCIDMYVVVPLRFTNQITFESIDRSMDRLHHTSLTIISSFEYVALLFQQKLKRTNAYLYNVRICIYL